MITEMVPGQIDEVMPELPTSTGPAVPAAALTQENPGVRVIKALSFHQPGLEQPFTHFSVPDLKLERCTDLQGRQATQRPTVSLTCLL